MTFEHLKSSFLSFIVVAFAVIWIGIMVSAAATIPVVGFVAAIPAALVVYALRSAVTGAAQDRVEIFHA